MTGTARHGQEAKIEETTIVQVNGTAQHGMATSVIRGLALGGVIVQVIIGTGSAINGIASLGTPRTALVLNGTASHGSRTVHGHRIGTVQDRGIAPLG